MTWCERFMNWWSGSATSTMDAATAEAAPSQPEAEVPSEKPKVNPQRLAAEEESRQEIAKSRAEFEKAEAAWKAFDLDTYEVKGAIRQHPVGPFLHLGRIEAPAKFIEDIKCVSTGDLFPSFFEGRVMPIGFGNWFVVSSRWSIPRATIEIRMSSGRAECWSCDPRVVEIQLDHLRSLWKGATA